MHSLALAALLRAMLSAYVLQTGFRALSDDDFSRVVIAQSFAAHPTLDPSGTSWLPFPFWIYGACLSVFGSSLSVARATAFLIGVLATCGVWLAGRWIGLTRGQSLLGAALASTLPYAAWLGVATTPDIFNAVLLVLACASLTRKNPRIRLLGALALIAATLSRYESWPVAVVWAGFAGLDAVRRKKWADLTLALLALAAPLAWMAHGIAHHHDALFFVKRVASYRRALGIAGGGSFVHLMTTPKHLLLDAPELWLLAALAVVTTVLRKLHPWRHRWMRPIWALLALLAFLVIGDWRDGAPTHHVGRTLLPIWLFVCLVIAKPLVRIGTSPVASRGTAAALVLGAFCLGIVLPRPDTLRVDAFCPRNEETEAGRRAAASVPREQRLAIQTSDYGYFAVQAAFGRPDDTLVFDRLDPRVPSASDVFASPETLRQGLATARAQWFVAPTSQEPKFPTNVRVHWRSRTVLLARIE